MNISLAKILWYAWSKKENIGYRETANLILTYGSIEEIVRVSFEEIEALGFLSEAAKQDIAIKIDVDRERKEYEGLKEKGIHFLIQTDEQYPERFRKMYDPPWFIYYRGELPKDDLPSVAIIGARNCTNYGADIARKLAIELAKNQIQIISGLARGVDGCAHRGALDGDGKTYGVIGCGVDICYPRENYQLFHDMSLQGGIISEYPIGSKALPFHFPIRNRLIAALSDGILVVEAKEKSGTFITVDCGLEQGKDIYAIPGKATDLLSRGCNLLIQNGARLVLSTDDILEELSNHFPHLQKNGVGKQLGLPLHQDISEQESIVLKYISYEPIHMERLLEETGLETTNLMEIIYSLQVKGLLEEVSSQYFVLHIK